VRSAKCKMATPLRRRGLQAGWQRTAATLACPAPAMIRDQAPNAFRPEPAATTVPALRDPTGERFARTVGPGRQSPLGRRTGCSALAAGRTGRLVWHHPSGCKGGGGSTGQRRAILHVRHRDKAGKAAVEGPDASSMPANRRFGSAVTAAPRLCGLFAAAHRGDVLLACAPCSHGGPDGCPGCRWVCMPRRPVQRCSFASKVTSECSHDSYAAACGWD
jgi:hypothetical protein